ncbi:SWI/SNF global transcription activator complex component SWP82 [Wickerhamomyces ciferrii]|uniref:SWI/SNF global transcription activator complex component SWP82 n=1 Tax=Wickerhamomyces ciferrii (strain ATCC 14091 / BCRC 22168 / CBS 111 / JCM 3599 / NBRC 0793 / NRRL Y-1031 F-60-10) TaxID=1206466 RepID=K0KA55_WICCF|nr:SWI/SNF global transcription activator complex component SWP82 [Wickerhamomyces ciferrii]CCH41805.1 SWI/SNF global transcription activator complex component SWP82 [Wickerhamomyces ciferrii]
MSGDSKQEKSQNPLISEIEQNLPENTPENPQPRLFKVTKADLYEHTQYTKTFPKNLDVKAPIVEDYQNVGTLTEDGVDYEVTKTDPKGEEKITENGYLLGGRQYILSTFTLPGRGKKLFVLGTEAAKFLNSRDAFVLFNKYKQLCKSTASDEERKFLEKCNFSISKIKSRSVAFTSARNLYMVFGARILKKGKRIVDDYWEDSAKEQGFKETDQVFPVDRNTTVPKPEVLKPKPAPKPLPKAPKVTFINPLPPIEDRRDYLTTFSQGNPIQVLPGQGITGGLELASVATIPKYKNEHTGGVKHRSILSTLSTSSSTPSLSTQSTTIPINDSLVGEKSPGGLLYYHSSVIKRINQDDSEKIKEIEYLHGTVETNNYIALARKPREKQWNYYWQVKSGTPLGLTEKDKDKYFQEQEESLKEIKEETIYNELLYCDQIIKKRKIPNPNYIKHGNIEAPKPPYYEKPIEDQPQNEQQQIPQSLNGQPSISGQINPNGQPTSIPNQIPSGTPISQPYHITDPQQTTRFPTQSIPQQHVGFVQGGIPQGLPTGIPQQNVYGQYGR